MLRMKVIFDIFHYFLSVRFMFSRFLMNFIFINLYKLMLDIFWLVRFIIYAFWLVNNVNTYLNTGENNQQGEQTQFCSHFEN